jgi:uncharacterized membrane protein
MQVCQDEAKAAKLNKKVNDSSSNWALVLSYTRWSVLQIRAYIQEIALTVLQRFKQAIKNDLIAGLLVVIPLATTIWLTVTISNWVISFLTQIPKQLNPFNDLHPVLTDLLNLFVGLSVPLLSLILIGLMARNIVGRWLLDTGETVVNAIPLAGPVYKTLKQLLETLLQDSRERFSRVVLVEYPRRGIWALGFVTGTLGARMTPFLSGQMLSLFIPTSPNPTTGWYAVVPEQDVVTLDMSIEDAFKLIISGGIVSPNWSALASANSDRRLELEPLPTLSHPERQEELEV